MKPHNPVVAAGLRRWRLARGMTRRALSVAVGCGINRPKALEDGHAPITREFALACAALDAGLPPVDFWDSPEKPLDTLPDS